MNKFLLFLLLFISLRAFSEDASKSSASDEGKPVIKSGSEPSTNPKPPAGTLIHDFDSGLVYKKGDFKWVSWGYFERLYNPTGDPSWKRFRQGMEFDLPRYSEHLRSAFVYEVDLTDNDFGKQEKKWKIFENLFLTLQDAEDAGKFRVLIGENTHILSREDNLSSGNLPTISRSLILEEHGSVNSFGTQFGIQAQKALNEKYNLAISAQDNRGSLNTDDPKYEIGNSLAAKLSASETNENSKRKFTYGFGADLTRKITDKSFTLATSIGGEALGSAPATGDKLTLEADTAYINEIMNHNYSIELEALSSHFSESDTTATGAYVLGQINIFANNGFGSLDPFLRYDVVKLSQKNISDAAFQDAVRLGVNYNLPRLMNLVNLHFEYAHHKVGGPQAMVPEARAIDEARVEIRFSMTRYERY